MPKLNSPSDARRQDVQYALQDAATDAKRNKKGKLVVQAFDALESVIDAIREGRDYEVVSLVDDFVSIAKVR